MSAGFLGFNWKRARKKRVADRAAFLRQQYPGMTEKESFDIAWELERFVRKERQRAKAL